MRNLDWLNDDEKVYLDCSVHPNLSRALSSVIDSQIIGGKRYDLAAEGRRLSNATFSESHACDTYTMLNYAMDLTPLIKDKSLNIADYVASYIKRFEFNVRDVIMKLIKKWQNQRKHTRQSCRDIIMPVVLFAKRY